mmetsp:Transcript_74032/g.197317  ORF Transcript_74032/g.197317 Transcript_74032/m.197317 type:complete len:97 (+) Transcript_74032:1432-1722(+)
MARAGGGVGSASAGRGTRGEEPEATPATVDRPSDADPEGQEGQMVGDRVGDPLSRDPRLREGCVDEKSWADKTYWDDKVKVFCEGRSHRATENQRP